MINETKNNNNKIQECNKEIEDLTFYVDELKSELEAEREKSNEYYNEISNYKKQIEDFEDQYNNIIKEKENYFINLMNQLNLDFGLNSNFEFNNNSDNNIECFFNILKTSLCKGFDDLKGKINKTFLKFSIETPQLNDDVYCFGKLSEAIEKIELFLEMS